MECRSFVHRRFTAGTVSDELFGSFVEHLGRCVYAGIFEPGHPLADSDGNREDVLKLVRDLKVSIVRYPGGNFVSGFDWRDSIGPVRERPQRLEYAWYAAEPNTFGLDEFMQWCRKAGCEPMYAINLGTGTPSLAQQAVEYCNFPGGSYWSDMRKKNGHEEPYRVKYWCLGNEMDGDWQIGHKTAHEYGRIACETAKMMKMVDPEIKLCICGSYSCGAPHFGTWEHEVLNEAYDAVDFLSIHTYFYNRNQELNYLLLAPEYLDHGLESAIACCDAAGTCKKSDKKIMIALDEWNVWNKRNWRESSPETRWQVGRPLLEETYDVLDALTVGGVLLSMLDHCGRLKIANMAQLVNVIAPIMTEPGGRCWRQTIFYPFYLVSNYGRGKVLRNITESPELIGKSPYDQRKGNLLRSTFVWKENEKELVIFAFNRSQDSSISFKAELGGFETDEIIEAVELHNNDLHAVNTAEKESLVPCAISSDRIRLAKGRLEAELKNLSWNMFRIKVK